MDAETSGVSYHISNVERYLTYMVAEFSALAFLFGILLRLITDRNIPDTMYYICLIFFLGTSNFYAMLKVNVRSAFHKVPLKLWVSVLSTYVLRWCVCISILWSVAKRWDSTIEGGLLNTTTTTTTTNTTTTTTTFTQVESQKTALFARWILWWILPPAMNTTSLSVWMGGDLYPSAAVSLVLSIFVPPLIVLFVYLTPGQSRLIEVEKLDFFYYLLVGGFLVPSFVAQILRTYSPVGSKKHGNRWQLLGVTSYILTVFMTGYKLTPPNILSHLECMFSTTCELDFAPGTIFVPLLSALFVSIAIRGLGVMVYESVSRAVSRVEVDKHQLMDIYLLLTNPNFFMWIAIVLGTSSYSDAADMMDMYTMFFGGFCYFVSFPIERRFVVKRFAEEIIQQSVSNMRMPKSEIEDLWLQVKHPDRDWLSVDDLSYAIWIICKQTQGWSPGTAKLQMLARNLLVVMTHKSSGKDKRPDRVTYEEFCAYFAWHGKKIDFNTTTESENQKLYAFDSQGDSTSNSTGGSSNITGGQSTQQEFQNKWFTRRRKSSITLHFKRKRMSINDSAVVPVDNDGTSTTTTISSKD